MFYQEAKPVRRNRSLHNSCQSWKTHLRWLHEHLHLYARSHASVLPACQDCLVPANPGNCSTALRWKLSVILSIFSQSQGGSLPAARFSEHSSIQSVQDHFCLDCALITIHLFWNNRLTQKNGKHLVCQKALAAVDTIYFHFARHSLGKCLFGQSKWPSQVHCLTH